jgi:CubicO group peptidase (beta-lactamase class C family)
MKYFIFAVLLLISTILTGHDIMSQSKPFEQEIDAMFQNNKAIGIAVAVVKNNKITYTKAFGWQDKEAQKPLKEDHIFRIASISKSFSATSIMQLVEAGKISLDDDVSGLIGFKVRNPKFPETVITLRMLLSHLSSINDSEGYFSLDFINPDKNPNWAKCYSDYEPGKGYKYCNLNFNMVGTIIERISGERFDEYVRHHVLDPLGLYGGYCVDSLDRNKFATIYEYGSGGKYTAAPAAYASRSEELQKYVRGYSTPIFSPTGGMKISAKDLAQYMIMHSKMGKYKGKRIISKASAEQMQTPLSADEHYGLAIETTEKMIPGKSLKGHTGVAYGLFSAMYFHPKEKFGIVVISNGCDPKYEGGYNGVIRNTVNLLYEGLIK